MALGLLSLMVCPRKAFSRCRGHAAAGSLRSAGRVQPDPEPDRSPECRGDSGWRGTPEWSSLVRSYTRNGIPSQDSGQALPFALNRMQGAANQPVVPLKPQDPVATAPFKPQGAPPHASSVEA